jgi:hypothetical protein
MSSDTILFEGSDGVAKGLLTALVLQIREIKVERKGNKGQYARFEAFMKGLTVIYFMALCTYS